jgi:hypothetical protein
LTDDGGSTAGREKNKRRRELELDEPKFVAAEESSGAYDILDMPKKYECSRRRQGALARHAVRHVEGLRQVSTDAQSHGRCPWQLIRFRSCMDLTKFCSINIFVKPQR